MNLQEKSINNKLKQLLQQSKYVSKGIELVNEYLKGTYYQSKMARIAQLDDMNVNELVLDLLVATAYFRKEQLFSAVAAMLAGKLQLSNRKDAVTTVAELLAVLCQTDAFDILKENRMASLMLVSRVKLPPDLERAIENSGYPLPLVNRPEYIRGNYYQGETLILGRQAYHDGDICLDVLNLMNSMAFKLDTEFLSKVEENPKAILETPEQLAQWRNFKATSHEAYKSISQFQCFYLLNKVDKRGRIYSQGYHINPQGSSYKKAMVNLAKAELVEGVPHY